MIASKIEIAKSEYLRYKRNIILLFRFTYFWIEFLNHLFNLFLPKKWIFLKNTVVIEYLHPLLYTLFEEYIIDYIYYDINK